MDAGALIERAGDESGLEDWGDESFRVGLETLVGALDDEAGLSELGAAAIEFQIVANLVNRLRVYDWVRAHPVIRDEAVTRPVIVLGLPRTGTTLVHELLHRDPANRSLMRWEAIDSVPPPSAATFDTDPRIEAARVAGAAMDALNPGFRAIHYEAPDGPTECVAVLAQAFRSLLWSVVANIPSYTRWMLGADPGPAYDYHHLVLQVLQSGTPGRWALKTPQHAAFLDEVVQQYPDARLLMTHRDPVTVVASLCSLARSLGGTFSDADHTESLAATWIDVATILTDRVADFRDRHGDARIADVYFDDLLADPVAAVGRALEHFGEELSPAAARAMRAYAADDPRRGFGAHEYRAGDLGIDEAAVAERFEGYTERFGLARR